MGRQRKNQSNRKIVEANRHRFVNWTNLFEAIEDGVNPEKCCWACIYNEHDFSPMRAHVVAVRDGGSDEPDNFFLLCEPCHNEQPDSTSRSFQEKWLTEHESWITGSWKRWGPDILKIGDYILSGLSVNDARSLVKDLESELYSITKSKKPIMVSNTFAGEMYVICESIKEWSDNWKRRQRQLGDGNGT